jgi:two-component system sensor histidine kinase/response regulator
VTPPDSANSNSSRLLVVDDQPANIQVLGALLGRLGFEIVPANSGDQALKRLANRRPDLILLDVMMDGMDGFEVCRQIRANSDWADIPIIFLSAADDKQMTVRAFESGGVDYVTKPFNEAELVSRVKTHLALKAARDRLIRLAEDKDELLGILAHDCKNHLGGMHMSALLLLDHARTKDDPRLRQLAENIERSSGLMLSFVKEFLANAAADHGVPVRQERIDAKAAIAVAAQRHQEAARRKAITLRIDSIHGDATVVASAMALDQVLDNLLSNAIKFSPPGKEVVAGVREDHSSVECFVQDNGPGFTEKDHAQMFRRYARLSARPTGGEPSTGLGLSIVKRLTDALGAKLTCQRNAPSGATFTVRFAKDTKQL